MKVTSNTITFELGEKDDIAPCAEFLKEVEDKLKLELEVVVNQETEAVSPSTLAVLDRVEVVVARVVLLLPRRSSLPFHTHRPISNKRPSSLKIFFGADNIEKSDSC